MLNFAVQRHAFATVQRLEPGSGVIIRSLDMNAGVVADSAAELTAGGQLEFLKAFVQRLVPATDSLLLQTESDVPPGSGLGSSGALGVAIVAAIDCAYGRQRSAVDTAALANQIERRDLGYPGGDQDSYGAALGGINYLEYHRGGGLTPRRVQISDATRRALEHHSLLIYSGAAHVSASIHEDIRQSYDLENSPTVAALRRLQELAKVAADALETGDLTAYAAAMDESCGQLYRLHASCQSAEHRLFVAAIQDIVLGAKTCGAGGGGFLLVFTKSGWRSECIRRIEAMGGLVWPVSIDEVGVTSWREPPLPEREIWRMREETPN